MLDEITKEVLPGDDTQCDVTIVEESPPQTVLGFTERIIKVRRSEKVVTLIVERKNGLFEPISCEISTTLSKINPLMAEQTAIAREGYDF